MLDLARSRWTIVEAVRQQAARYGDREFAGFEDGRTLTFAGLDAESTAVAFGLARIGVRPGDRVLALMQNEVEFLPLLVGTNKLNAVFVTINTGLKGSFLEHQLRNSAPRAVIVDAELMPAFDGIDLRAVGVEAVVVVGGTAATRRPELGGLPTIDFVGLPVSAGDPRVLADPAPHDISTVMYTSGTTGPSKGVLMPHAHCYLLGYNLAATMGLTETDVYYVCMPLFHANALFMQTIGSLLCGARVAVIKRFSASRWLEDVRTCGATVTNGLGVMPEFIFRQPPTPYDRQHKLRAMMAVPIAAEWGPQFEARFGVRLVQGFGLTETNIVCYTGPDEPLTPGCAGRVLTDWFDVQVVDPETDEVLPAGEVGEIVVRPTRPWCFMAGYLHMPEKTVEAWRNLWFHTGDAGHFDAQGRLFFVDRIKDCIRRRGENISSYEVEQVINEHPAVAESAVIAVKSSIPGGEDEVKACIVLRPEQSLRPEALLDYCQERMPHYAVPRYVECLSELPKTPTGKVQKEPLRKQSTSNQTWDREAVGYRVRR